jgi:hypothetical protein
MWVSRFVPGRIEDGLAWMDDGMTLWCKARPGAIGEGSKKKDRGRPQMARKYD